MEILEISKSHCKSVYLDNKPYYTPSVADELNYNLKNPTNKGNLINRMQIDIERRKLQHETKVKMREYEERRQLSQMFVPKINERSKSRDGSRSVYERLADRRN